MKIVSKILFYSLLMIFPLGLILRFKIATNIYVTPQDILVLALFLMSILDFSTWQKLKPGFNFITFQLLFLAVGMCGLFVSFFRYNDVNLLSSFLYLLRYIAYLSLLNVNHLIGNENKNRRNLFLIVGFVFIVIGYFQYFFYFDLRYLYYLGWDDHLYRLFSTFLDPNYAGVFYSLLFFMIFSSVLYLKFEKSYKELIISFFAVIAIYLTYSRTALVSLLAGVIVLAILKNKLRIFLFGFLAFSIMLMLLSDVSIEGLNPFRTASSIERLISAKEAVAIFSDSPIIGIGFNTYRYAMLRHGFRTAAGASMSNADAGTDNSFLFVLATTGIIGACFFSLSYYFLLRKLFEEKNIIGLMPFCMIVAFITASLFLNTLFYTPILAFVFLVISFRKNIFFVEKNKQVR